MDERDPADRLSCSVSLTIAPAKSSSVQRARPSGGLAQAVAKPELMAEIEYRAKSTESRVRHPFFEGLREDLKAYFRHNTRTN